MLNRKSVRAAVAAMAILLSAGLNNHALAFSEGDLITYPQGAWTDYPTATGLLFHNYDSIYSSSFGIVEAGIPGAAGFSQLAEQPPLRLPASATLLNASWQLILM